MASIIPEPTPLPTQFYKPVWEYPVYEQRLLTPEGLKNQESMLLSDLSSVSLDRVREVLERARDNVERMWIKGQWFNAGFNTAGQVEINGVCLLGGVLHALGINNEARNLQNREFKACVNALFNVWVEGPGKNTYQHHVYQQDFRDCFFRGGLSPSRFWDMRFVALIGWNDEQVRQKHEVLDLLDATIKDVIKEMEKV